MKRYGKYKYIFLLIILLLAGGISWLMQEKSYGAFSNIKDVRAIVSNVASAFYDRGSYVQYDNSYMDNIKTVKRNSGFYYPEDANRDNTIYMDNVSFIANVFYAGLNCDIVDIFGEISLEAMFNYGSDIYNKAVLEEDERVNKVFTDSQDNSYVIDYYDNVDTRLTATIGPTDYHILTMYVNNTFIDSDINKNNIYNKLVETLRVGDIIIYRDYVLLYVGKDIFLYCSGENYDYINSIDKVEDRAIKYGNVSELNNSSSDKYLFSGDNFYVLRLPNYNLGYWKLPSYYKTIRNYFNTDVIDNTVPWIRIEKFSNINSYKEVTKDEEITYTIRITNNSNYDIELPDAITDTIGSNVIYVSNSYSEESFSNEILTFSGIGIMSNSYVDISYTVRVLDEDGTIVNNNTKIGDYSLNSISHRIIKKDMDNSNIKDSYQKYSSIERMYKKLYNIELDFTNIWDNIIDETGLYKDGYSLLVNGLYGGITIGTGSDMELNRARYVIEDNLIMGDIVIYNNGEEDNYLLYIKEDEYSYLVNYNNNKIIKIRDIDVFLESLIGMGKFMVIRPSYIYDPNKEAIEEELEFGKLEVLVEDMIILVRNTCVYGDIIKEISNYDKIIIKDIDNIELSSSDIVKSGDRLEIDDKVYTIALLGDINGDGLVDTGDVLKLHRFVLGKTSISDKYYVVASYINDDMEIDTGDVLKLHRFVLGKGSLN